MVVYSITYGYNQISFRTGPDDSKVFLALYYNRYRIDAEPIIFLSELKNTKRGLTLCTADFLFSLPLCLSV